MDFVTKTVRDIARKNVKRLRSIMAAGMFFFVFLGELVRAISCFVQAK